MKKLIWRGTLKEAEEHPLFKLGYQEGQKDSNNEFLLFLKEVEINADDTRITDKIKQMTIKLKEEFYDEDER